MLCLLLDSFSSSTARGKINQEIKLKTGGNSFFFLVPGCQVKVGVVLVYSNALFSLLNVISMSVNTS